MPKTSNTNASLNDVVNAINNLSNSIETVVNQQRRGVPKAAFDYAGGRITKPIFGETSGEKLERLRKEILFQNKETRASVSIGGQLTDGIRKSARELEYEKERLNSSIESYEKSYKKNTEELRDILGESNLNEEETLQKATEKFNELSEASEKLREQQEKTNETLNDFLLTINDFDEEKLDEIREILREGANKVFDENGNLNVQQLQFLTDDLNIATGNKDFFDVKNVQQLLGYQKQLNSETNDLVKAESERDEIGKKITNIYEKQVDALREVRRAAETSVATMKNGFSNIARGFHAIKSEITDFVKGWREVDQASSNFAKNIGIGSVGLKALRQNTIDMVANQGIGLDYGIGMNELIEAQQTYMQSTGRNLGLTREDVETTAAMSRLMSGKGGEFAAALENFGLSYTEAGKRAGKMFQNASKYGLSFEKYSQNFLTNIKLAQNYTFRDGLRGLERMAQKATAIRIDMQQIASFADKVSTLEGAVQVGASLQVLGGPFAQFGDALGMLNEGLNDVEGLMNRFQGMFQNFGKFNKETGQVDITAFNRQRIRAAAEAMGMDYNQVMESVQAQGRRKYIDEAITQNKGVRNFTDEEKEFIRNTATVQNGKVVMSYLTNEGKRVEKEVTKMSSREIQTAKTQNQSDSDNIKTIAKATRSFDEKVKGFNEFKKAVKAEAAEPIMDVLKDGFDILSGYLSAIKIAVLAISAGKLIGGGARMVRGAVEWGRGFRNLLDTGTAYQNLSRGVRGINTIGQTQKYSNLGTFRRFRAGFFQSARHGGRAVTGFGRAGNLGSKVANFGGKYGSSAKWLGVGGRAASGVLGAVGAIGTVIYGIYDGIKTYNEGKKTEAERNKQVSLGNIRKGSKEDRELTRKSNIEKAGGKGKGIGVAAGAAAGAAIGSVFPVIGHGVGALAGAIVGLIGGGAIGRMFGGKSAIEENKRREIQARRERGYENILKRHGFELKGGYEEKELKQILTVINHGQDNTITKTEFESLPEELKKKMMENGDVSLFPDLEEFSIAQANVDAETMTVNAGDVTINGNTTEKKAKGGLLNGPSHSMGGMPIAGTNIEVEGGEYVVNKKATKNNLPLLEAINQMGKGGVVNVGKKLSNGGFVNIEKNITNSIVNGLTKMSSGGLINNRTTISSNSSTNNVNGTIVPVKDTAMTPMKVEPTKDITVNGKETQSNSSSSIDINIKGTIELVSDGNKFDISELLRDPKFKQQIQTLIAEQTVYKEHGGRFATQLSS